eukprot:1136400-Pelagomonas_calceolata.AAC.1
MRAWNASCRGHGASIQVDKHAGTRRGYHPLVMESRSTASCMILAAMLLLQPLLLIPEIGNPGGVCLVLEHGAPIQVDKAVQAYRHAGEPVKTAKEGVKKKEYVNCMYAIPSGPTRSMELQIREAFLLMIVAFNLQGTFLVTDFFQCLLVLMGLAPCVQQSRIKSRMCLSPLQDVSLQDHVDHIIRLVP